MSNLLQQSIARTRAKMHELGRRFAVAAQKEKRDKELANSNLALLLDEIAAETGLDITKKNLPTIMLYVQQFASDQQKRKGNSDGVDPEGMADFPI
jgi:hypothetical protein